MLAKQCSVTRNHPRHQPRHGALGLEGTCYSPHNLGFYDVEVQSRAKMHTYAASSSPEFLKGRAAVGQHPYLDYCTPTVPPISDRLGARYVL